ncbi:taurine catabolism dioxygenase [Aaosphaeria arxii CBS 175.79]|uniref:Taurine catabolism dioxygenase n=1 Tax=Aaosphaeria arxii CBS 175.79 TaxID=1450172 RepID=A0A6A5XH99_9PLEO|nr:taurine catabolism dioxygenase [Aaosphaeria arxii CBS 175.79]KAF2012472.1 taurine catabolism dioxygenase [Aaosphaeria arxii CBS 175.79]
MPGLLTQDTPFETISIKELHSTFAAEVIGADFHNMSDKQLKEIKSAMAKYGVLVFRQTEMSDDEHVAFSAKLGELDNVKRYLTGGRKLRYKHFELFDAGNVDEDGNVIHPDAPRSHYNKGNALFHVDSSFNPRRASWSLLRAVKLPPPNTGGETAFADSRAAFDDLDEDTKNQLLEKDYIGAHTLLHSRKLGSPEFFADLDPTSQPMTRHRLVQTHEPSGRKNLYIAAHCHHLETDEGPLPENESNALLKKLMDHVTSPKHVLHVDWINTGDMIAWDNTCVLHRATGGGFEGKHIRDVRRTTVHDDSPTAWGLNAGQEARGFNLQKAMGQGQLEDTPVVKATA